MAIKKAKVITELQKKRIIERLKPQDPQKIGVFGSYARDRENDKSDLDLLVDFRKRLNLFDLLELEKELSKILGVKVDLVTEKSLNKHLRQHILDEVIYILNEEQG